MTKRVCDKLCDMTNCVTKMVCDKEARTGEADEGRYRSENRSPTQCCSDEKSPGKTLVSGLFLAANISGALELVKLVNLVFRPTFFTNFTNF